jgi:hypothetical protein
MSFLRFLGSKVLRIGNMVRIDERLVSDTDLEDTSKLDAERALVAASEYDGGNIGDLTLLLGRNGNDAVHEAIRRGWFEKDRDDERMVIITPEGKEYYRKLKDGCRHPLDYSEPDLRELHAATQAGMFPFLMPKEHTTTYVCDTLPPPPPPSKKIEDQ